MDEITVNGVTYVKKQNTGIVREDGLQYCIVRTYSAGVFAGWYKSHGGKEATVYDARRLWFWSGAASLSQLAMEGVKHPSKCKFPCDVPQVTLTEVIEVIPCSEVAMKCIQEVPVWKQ